MAGYIPNTTEEQQQMLAAIGVDSMEGLLCDIPQSVRLQREYDLPAPLTEMELSGLLQSIAQKNTTTQQLSSFLGGGAYEHYVPAVVSALTSRQEFFTAYTPYQPEISQGTLQAIFEFQSMICELTGMDVANASLYDGASAYAEAMHMACSETRRKEFVVLGSVHPDARAVLATYAEFLGYTLVVVPTTGGAADLEAVRQVVSKQTAGVAVQNPNYFGVVEDVASLADIAHEVGALLVAGVDPVALGLLETPAALGADIALGDGQPFGNALNFGGPYVGFFATKTKYLRKMPGRIVGETVDSTGKRGFVLTMQTREQHIRREKATSNICSNQGLCALAATIHMTWLGKQGLLDLSNLCLQKAHYTYHALLETGLFQPISDAPFFREFAVCAPVAPAVLNARLLEQGVLGGIDLSTAYPELVNAWLISVTETKSKDEIDAFIRKVVACCAE